MGCICSYTNKECHKVPCGTCSDCSAKYYAVREEVWRFAAELSRMSEKELIDCYQLDCVSDVLRQYTYNSAIVRFDEWQDEHNDKLAALDRAMANLHNTLKEVHDARKALGLCCGETFTINLDKAVEK